MTRIQMIVRTQMINILNENQCDFIGAHIFIKVILSLMKIIILLIFFVVNDFLMSITSTSRKLPFFHRSIFDDIKYANYNNFPPKEQI